MMNNKTLYKIAFGLALFTIVYNVAEDLISTYLGFEDESLALLVSDPIVLSRLF